MHILHTQVVVDARIEPGLQDVTFLEQLRVLFRVGDSVYVCLVGVLGVERFLDLLEALNKFGKDLLFAHVSHFGENVFCRIHRLLA